MNGEGIRYPAVLLGGDDTKPLAFKGPGALFISGRFRPPLGPMDEVTLVDSSGRSWALHAVTAVDRWGTWRERLLLWWRRQYRVNFEATEQPGMSLDDLKGRLLERVLASEAALMADVTVDGEIRNYFLEASRTGREDLMATETFEGVVEVMEPRSLYRDNWFSPRGRSNRAEYLAVLIVAVVISGMAQRVASLLPEFWSLVPLALGTAVMVWLIWAAIARRCHDLGWAFRWLALVMVVGSGVAEAAEGHFQLSFPWPSALLVCVPILAFAILPGEPRENRYDPPPNPGLAL